MSHFYNGPRRKSKLQKACETLDPGVRLVDRSFSGGGRWNTAYEVKDGAGVVIGYTDPKDPPRFAWSMALESLRRRERGTI
jgi:hypothetical protein